MAVFPVSTFSDVWRLLRTAWQNAADVWKILLLVVAAAMLSTAFLLWWRTPDYGVLFSQLEEKDGGQILTALQQMDVDFRLTAGGHTILVPRAQVNELRLRLAAQGLPKNAAPGFDNLTENSWNQSQFSQQVAYQRALEGELSRSVQSLTAVASARVHLALPRQSGFLRDEREPSAAVLLHLKNGQSLTPAQVEGIVHLVAAGVPNLKSNRVAVVDDQGKDLSNSAPPSPWTLKQELANELTANIHELLGPVLGRDNFRALVSVDLAANDTVIVPRRLAVAVVVDSGHGRRKINTQELTVLESLIKQAVGFDERRGDSLVLVPASFLGEENAPSGAGDSKTSNQGLWWVVAALLLMVVLWYFRYLNRPVPLPEPEEAPSPSVEERIIRARQLVRQNPQKVAQVIRQWMERP